MISDAGVPLTEVAKVLVAATMFCPHCAHLIEECGNCWNPIHWYPCTGVAVAGGYNGMRAGWPIECHVLSSSLCLSNHSDASGIVTTWLLTRAMSRMSRMEWSLGMRSA